MTDKVKKYFSKNPPKGARSRLWVHRDVILELRDGGASLRQVCDFLRDEECVKITQKNLSSFIKKINHTQQVGTPLPPRQATAESIKKVAQASTKNEDWMPKIKPGHGLYEF